MPAVTATAPGKVILFGEHAVVYGRPAIAVPIAQVQARAVITAEPLTPAGSVRLVAPDVGLEAWLADLPASHPLAAAVQATAVELRVASLPACRLWVSSTIPVAAGMGSGAAVSVAIIRALSAFLGRPLPVERVSALAFQVEHIYHGTPSGIDNSVIAYARPVYFVKGRTLEVFQVRRAFTLVIGDTGVASATALAVGAVRQAWQAEPQRYEALFDAVGALVQPARWAIEHGQPEALGRLMVENQSLLRQMGVSSPELEGLIAAAGAAGALGAKLCGAGRGGSMIALTTSGRASEVAAALQNAGARRVILAEVTAS
jgi:mevalonate kinase